MLNMILAIVISFVAAIAAGAVIIPQLRKRKAGQQVRDDGPKSHLKKQGTPTMGGIIMVISIIITSVIFMRGNIAYMIFSLVSMVAIMFVGFFDDYIKLFKKRSLGLRAYQKILFQLIISAAIAVIAMNLVGTQIALPFTDKTIELGFGFVPFTMFVIIAMINAVNLTDGLDGLAAGVTAVNSASFTIIAMTLAGITVFSSPVADTNMYNIMIFSATLTGSCLGFIHFNKYPAKVFMGDTGSFALGAALVMIGILTKMQLLLPIFGIMFVLSCVSVVLQVGSYKLRRKRIFKMAPLHHHFELCGMHETKVVLMYVLITVAVCVISLLLL